MKKYVPDEEPHIVEDYYIGNTHIQIATNYCIPYEEVPAHMKRLTRQLQPILVAQMIKEMEEENGA